MKALAVATGGELVSTPRWALDAKEAKLREALGRIEHLRTQVDEYAEAYRQVCEERDSARRERDEAHQKLAELRAGEHRG